MTKDALELLKSQHKMAIDLARSFIATNPTHACKEDLERLIDFNIKCLRELNDGCGIQDD